MRQKHTPSEKLFVDYSGDRIAVIDAKTGEIREAELFVAVLGASNANRFSIRLDPTWSNGVVSRKGDERTSSLK